MVRNKYIVIITTAMALLMLMGGCSFKNTDDSSKKLTMYILNDERPFTSLMTKYNDSCNDDDKIDFVKFQDVDQLNTKLTTELMAGKGPDIIIWNDTLPMEKLISQDYFADFNQLMENDSDNDKLNMDNYKKSIMDSGVINNIRYVIPISYNADFLITTKEICNDYFIPYEKTMSYNEAANVLSNFLNKNTNTVDISVFYSVTTQYNRVIDKYVDFAGRKYNFDSEEFLSEINALSKMTLMNDEQQKRVLQPIEALTSGKVLFVSHDVLASGPVNTGYIYHQIAAQNQNPVIINQFSDSNKISACIENALLINKNSANQQKAYKFIKYMLSEEVQSKREIGLPVNINSQIALVEEMKTETYDLSISDGINYCKEGIDDSFVSSYVNFLNGINSCTLPGSYYNENIVNDSISKYISGDISKEKFIDEIKNKTQIYLQE